MELTSFVFDRERSPRPILRTYQSLRVSTMALRLLTRSSPNNLTATTTSFNRINRSFSSSISRPSSPSTPSTPAASTLTWPNYLSLRRSQRRFGLVASIPTTFGGFMVGASYFATIEAEPTSTIMGLEPILA